MSFFRSLGRVFTKGSSKIGSLFEKGGRELSGAITRGASTIGRGIGSLGGAALGSELGGAAASVFGPEAIPIGSALGSIIGRSVGGELGSRGAQQIGKMTAPVRRSAPVGMPRNVNMIMPPVQPPILPGPKPMVGRDGAGIYRGPPLSVGQKKEMMEKKRNSLEINKPKSSTVQIV
jgi:hypothetical protein